MGMSAGDHPSLMARPLRPSTNVFSPYRSLPPCIQSPSPPFPNFFFPYMTRREDAISNTFHINFISFQLVDIFYLFQTCVRISFLIKHTSRISFLIISNGKFENRVPLQLLQNNYEWSTYASHEHQPRFIIENCNSLQLPFYHASP